MAANLNRPRTLFRQRDFSGGEIVPYAKRRDDLEMVRAGCRQLKNRRILATGGTEQRPGRAALFCDGARVDEVRLSPTVTFRLCFAAGILRIRDSAGAVVATAGGMPWATATLDKIRWARFGKEIFICFTAMRPIVATWDGTSTWTLAQFSFRTGIDGYKRQPYARLSALGATMTATGLSGSVTVTFSQSVLVASHVGAIFRYFGGASFTPGRRVRITAAAGTTGTATVLDPLPPTDRISMVATSGFRVGDVVEGLSSASKGIVVAVSAGPYIDVVTTSGAWDGTEVIIGPTYRSTATSVNPGTGPSPLQYWDEELVNDLHGWPQGVTADGNRLIFYDLPQVPNAMMWSAIGDPYDFEVTAEANSAIVEFAPGDCKVLEVVGALSDQFVFTDQGIRYIPISVSNPLVPGSVSFNLISDESAAQVRPIATNEGVIFVNEAQNRVKVVVGTGQGARPYVTRDLSEMHEHLFSGVKAIAVTSGGGDVVDRYIYAANDDGTMALGRLNAAKDWVGWAPWESGGSGTISWVSSLGADVLTTTLYGSRYLTEQIDPDAYLDAQVTLNDIPDALATGSDSGITIAYWAGTRIGDMTANGGLAVAFDNNAAQNAAASASRAASSGYAGKTFDVAMRILQVVSFPSTDSGYAAGEVGNITLQLYGKNGTAPANSTDGTLLSSGTLADTTSQTVIASNDSTTSYTHVWVRVANASATNVYLAELQFFTPGLSRAASAGGSGDLWFLESQTVDLMDGLSYMATRGVEVDGDVTPAEGDDLTVATLVTGFKWEEVIEPFVPHAGEGKSFGQTLHPRDIGEVAVAVQNSVGFAVRKIDGTVLREVSPYRVGDNQDEDPTPREEVWVVPLSGSDYDPRFKVTRDAPGPNRILEISFDPEV
jgi:hypothetical protein